MEERRPSRASSLLLRLDMAWTSQDGGSGNEGAGEGKDEEGERRNEIRAVAGEDIYEMHDFM